MTRYAVSDIGTNSVRLMLADENCRPAEKRLLSTRIGEKLSETGGLTEGGMARTLNALSGYAKAAHEFGAPLWVFATSAVRDATNKSVFLDRALDAGIPVEVVSGETEAKLAYLGIGALEKLTLIDIGGGSTEAAKGKGGELGAAYSAPVGCVRALERYGSNPSDSELAALSEWLLDAKVSGGEITMCEALASFKPAGRVYAVSGTATSLASIFVGVTQEYSAGAVHGKVVTKEGILAVLENLRKLTVEQRCAIPVLSDRGELIIHGGVLLLTSMDALGSNDVVVSDSDNLEGYLRYRLNRGE